MVKVKCSASMYRLPKFWFSYNTRQNYIDLCFSEKYIFVSGELEILKMADIYFYQGDTDENDGGYCDANITATNQVSFEHVKYP